MDNQYILDLLQAGKDVDDIKEVRSDDVRKLSLSGENVGEKKRYKAQKKFIRHMHYKNTPLKYPTLIHHINLYMGGYLFIDDFGFAITTDTIGDIEPYEVRYSKHAQKDNRFDGNWLQFHDNAIRMVNTLDGVTKYEHKSLDVFWIFTNMTASKYKFKTSEMVQPRYLLKYRGNYYNFANFELLYNIIDSGHCTIYDTKDSDIEVLKHSMVVMTDVGTMMLLKMKFNRDIENVITPIIGYDDMYILNAYGDDVPVYVYDIDRAE